MVRSVTVKQGELPVVGKADRIMKNFRSIPNMHSNDVRGRELMVWNVIHNFEYALQKAVKQGSPH